MPKSNINFSAGPSALPAPVIARANKEIWDWYAPGISLLEVSHRCPPFLELVAQNEKKLRTLLAIDDRYAILFMQGGATLQFFGWCANLLNPHEVADFSLTGHWSQRAYQEANRTLAAATDRHRVAFDGSEQGYATIADPRSWALDRDADAPPSRYLHYTDNETVHGVEFAQPPDVGKLLVCDMSSNILSRPFAIDPFACIYASSQKNLGVSGVTVVVVRRDLLVPYPSQYPSLLSYQKQLDSNNLPNTPSTFSLYLLALYLDWLIDNGGVAAAHQRSLQRSQALYDAIDSSGGFYTNPVDPAVRSRMNIVFDFSKDCNPATDHTAAFAAFAADRGLHFLKGHRIRGGIRASLYNSATFEAVERLIDCMADYKKQTQP